VCCHMPIHNCLCSNTLNMYDIGVECELDHLKLMCALAMEMTMMEKFYNDAREQ
jgi:hypothetical protein